MVASSSRPVGVGCQHTATRLAVLLRGSNQLLEPGIVLDVAPPPVRGPRQPDSMSGVRRHLVLKQAKCFVPVTQQQVCKGLIRKEFDLRVDIGYAARSGKQVASAITA